ncbi:phosphoglycerate kinase [Sodalis-like secondary symbiont of Drepanosiphum platanoidis]|uniref:phosphoglycerate kinase n=1 Tax=Sodalis-like secondary symbiont of Drepanosiphum platanoidis TaxID=2994493 RepID=UPI003464A502
MNLIKMTDLNLFNKRVLIRSDLNVPLKDKKITSFMRITSSLPAIKFAIEQKATVLIASHLGRPIEGEYNSNLSLYPIAKYLKKILNHPIRFVKDYINGFKINSGEVVLLENVRFNKGEKKNDDKLGKKYSKLCDIFVMDAFGSLHRSHASTNSVAKFSSISCAGPLLCKEIKEITKALDNPKRPMVSVVGGSKVSTKLTVLNSLAKMSDILIVGGGIANTLLASQGYNIGNSLYEADLMLEAKNLYKYGNILLPKDVKVSTEFSENSYAKLKSIENIKDNEQILDLGDKSCEEFSKILINAKTILWNGPVGVFEFSNFRKGTETIGFSIAKSKAFSIAGGGDTISAIDLLNIKKEISYISTGGGAFIEFLEKKELPILSILKNKLK